MFCKARCMRGSQHSGFTQLEVPQDPTNTSFKQCKDWISINVPTKIEERLQICNQHHFSQAQGTFPTIPPFPDGWTGQPAHMSPIWSWKLTGMMMNYFHFRTIYLPTCNGPQHWPPSAISSPPQNGLTKNKKWLESTLTSPSGFHLTHRKALVAKYDLDPESPEGQLLEAQCSNLVLWQVQLTNQAIRNC